MKAIICERYGLPETTLQYGVLDRPVPKANEVLVRIRAASVNPGDWYFATGTPYLIRLFAGLTKPNRKVLGIDGAGVVEAVGESVRSFTPGDEVFGDFSRGSYAELACASDKKLALKPTRASFEEAASIPTAGLTALQALRDHGRLKAGQRVLVNGASGGIGTLAVQIAKAMGAEVTGVCSGRNVEMVQSLGADEVIDYTTKDFTQLGVQYDLIADTVSNHSHSEIRRALTTTGTWVAIGAVEFGDWIGPIIDMLKTAVASARGCQRFVSFVSKPNRSDLEYLARLVDEGKLRAVISDRYDLKEAAVALASWRAGHAQGKKVITVGT